MLYYKLLCFNSTQNSRVNTNNYVLLRVLGWETTAVTAFDVPVVPDLDFRGQYSAPPYTVNTSTRRRKTALVLKFEEECAANGIRQVWLCSAAAGVGINRQVCSDGRLCLICRPCFHWNIGHCTGNLFKLFVFTQKLRTLL